ncbi:hypothetical protein [uncultured Desulfuromonas sp.]|uniref:hypothetical protein n=1 Tax=uncultured Desulfuromonas sp. TaxID=181013 RepID=UPI002AAB7BF6|nr:hypothetical protein [uncultured Desulfuromonas sp.]
MGKVDAKEIETRLQERKTLMQNANNRSFIKENSKEVSVILQFRDNDKNKKTEDLIGSGNLNKHIHTAVTYRLSTADLFVEKAQYHLEERAKGYKWWGFSMYSAAAVLFLTGIYLSWQRMDKYEIDTILSLPTDILWIDLLTKFVLAFTAYGFIVLTAVALSRIARACLDQRERLLSKRHSLRQGRLYIHLTGGNVTIDEIERAFNWNHDQINAFTNMPTDAKAPWGNVLGEIAKIAPELVKVGTDAAQKKEK